MNRGGLVQLADACHFIAPLPGGGNFKKIIDPPTDGNFGKISPPLGVGITEKYPPPRGAVDFGKLCPGHFSDGAAHLSPRAQLFPVSSIAYFLTDNAIVSSLSNFRTSAIFERTARRTCLRSGNPPTYCYGHNCRGQFSVLPPKSPRQKYELVYWLNFQRKYDLAPGRWYQFTHLFTSKTFYKWNIGVN